MGTLQNQFSWSKSRDEKFRECQRQYYFHHYGSWGGWDRRSDPKVRELYILKNLKSRHMWLGEVVHHTIENALKHYQAKEELPTEYFLDQITQKMRKDFRESKTRQYREAPNKAFGLAEHEFEMNISDQKWVEVHDNARRCFTNFANIIFPNMVKPVPVEYWKLIETMQTFNFEGSLIYVKIDFAVAAEYDEKSERMKVPFRSERSNLGGSDGEPEGRAVSPLTIIDWKTGRTDDVDNQIQLDCYGMFSKDFFKIPTETIKTVEANVNVVKSNVTQMIEAKIDFAKHYIRNSIAGMKRVLADQEKNVAREEDFPFTDNDQTCRWCNFRNVCPKMRK